MTEENTIMAELELTINILTQNFNKMKKEIEDQYNENQLLLSNLTLQIDKLNEEIEEEKNYVPPPLPVKVVKKVKNVKSAKKTSYYQKNKEQILERRRLAKQK